MATSVRSEHVTTGVVEKARIADVPEMKRIIDYYAQRDRMLFRSLAELYGSLRDYFVWREEGQVVGCCALHIMWKDLAEIRGLAVRPEYQGRGIGRCLVAACVEEAQALGVRTVFTLTLEPAFFEKCGFRRVERQTLSVKVWQECYRCPKFSHCDEIAMIRHLSPVTEERTTERP